MYKNVRNLFKCDGCLQIINDESMKCDTCDIDLCNKCCRKLKIINQREQICRRGHGLK